MQKPSIRIKEIAEEEKQVCVRCGLDKKEEPSLLDFYLKIKL